MADGRLAKIVLLQAPPEGAGRLEAALRALVAHSRREEGSVECLLHAAAEDEGRYMVYERWRDAAAFDAHMASPHVAAFLAEADTLLAVPAEVLAYDLLS